jgi:hypothetical protein
MRFAVYSVPGGLTPAVVWTAPSDEGTHFAVFLSPHPERLLSELLHSTPHEILSHFRPEEICDAYIIGMIEHDGTFHTERTECTERGKSDLLLAMSLLQSRKTKPLATGAIVGTVLAAN